MRKDRVELCQLRVDRIEVGNRVPTVARIHGKQMEQSARSFNMLEKPHAEACPLRGAGYESGNVRDDETRFAIDRNDTKVRNERRKRIVAHGGTGARDGADECALPDVGEPEEAHIGQKLQLEA